jgi:hypothetical protein
VPPLCPVLLWHNGNYGRSVGWRTNYCSMLNPLSLNIQLLKNYEIQMLQRDLYVCCNELCCCKLASPVSYHFRSRKILNGRVLAKQSIWHRPRECWEKVSAIEFIIKYETRTESYKWSLCQEESSLIIRNQVLEVSCHKVKDEWIEFHILLREYI